MHKANQEMESNALYSGTGVFYQAMPAVGADGRNVMKLIPVQKVNGQFVPSQTSGHKVDSVQPQRPKTTTNSSQPTGIQIVNTVTLNTSANGQFMKRQMSSPKDVGEERRHLNGNCTKANSSPQNVANFVTQARATLPRLPRRQSVAAKNNLPVTVNSPVLPNGRYLQLAVKKKIVTPTTSATTTGSSSPTVLFVSPAQTTNQGTTPALSITSVTSIKSPSTSADQASCRPSSTGSTTPASWSVAADSQRPKSPIKWVIEEGDGSLAPCLVPVHSPVAAERETTPRSNAHEAAAPKKAPVPSPSPPKGGAKKDDALMMCNGKVYLLAKRGNVLPGSPPAAKSCGSVKKAGSQPLLQLGSVTGASPQTSNASQNSIQIRIPDRSNEIIDLCDDEPPDAAAPRALWSVPPRVIQTDEDNVIFVSYCPPGSSAAASEKNANGVVPARKEAPVLRLARGGPERDGAAGMFPDKGPVRLQNVVIGRDSATISVSDGAILADDPRHVIFVSYNPPNGAFGSEKNRIDNNVPASKLTPAPLPAQGPVQNAARNPDRSNDRRAALGRQIATALTGESRRNTPAADNCHAGGEAQQILTGRVREPNGTDRPSGNIPGPGMETIRHSAPRPADRVEVHHHRVVSDVQSVPHAADTISDGAAGRIAVVIGSAAASANESCRNATTAAADRGRVGGEEVRAGKRQVLAAGTHGRDSSNALNGTASKPRVMAPPPPPPGPDVERNLRGETNGGQRVGAASQPTQSANVHPINAEWMELMENIQHEDSVSDGADVKPENGAERGAEKSKCCRNPNDRLLRQIFGITADIRVYLEKVDAPAHTGSAATKGIPVVTGGVTPPPPPRLPIESRSVQEWTSRLKEGGGRWASQGLGDPKQRRRGAPAAENATDAARADGLAAAPRPAADLSGSPSRWNAFDSRGPPPPASLSRAVRPAEIAVLLRPDPKSSPKDIPCDVDFERTFGPMEPVDEDLDGGADGINGVRHKPCCAESSSSAKPKRKGKPKMCTACPCGMPVAAAAAAAKTHAKQKKRDPTPQQGGATATLESGKVRRKRGRPRKSSSTAEREETPPAAKVPRKIERLTPGGRTTTLAAGLSTEGERRGHTTEDSPAAGGSGDPPAATSESAESETNDEKKMQERIERLKDLLREKEAALEMYRKNMG